MRTSDWMKLQLGDRVIDLADPRHEGCVDQIRWGHEVKVTWDNGWVSWIALHHLKRVSPRNIIIR
jgi:hypothetical protein